MSIGASAENPGYARVNTGSRHQDYPALLLFLWVPNGGGRGNSIINSRAGQGGRGKGNLIINSGMGRGRGKGKSNFFFLHDEGGRNFY